MTRCLPSATLWKTPDQHSLLGSLLAHSLSTLFTCSFLRSFTSLALWVLFAGEGTKSLARSLAAPSASVRPPRSPRRRPRPSARCPPPSLALLTQFLPAMLHQRFLLLLLRGGREGIKKRPGRAGRKGVTGKWEQNRTGRKQRGSVEQGPRGDRRVWHDARAPPPVDSTIDVCNSGHKFVKGREGTSRPKDM